MAARKRPNNKTSNYLISMSENDLNRESKNYLGKLRSNFVGTEFQVCFLLSYNIYEIQCSVMLKQIFGSGINPKDAENLGQSVSDIREELGAVIYAANVLGSRGPRKMQVLD